MEQSRAPGRDQVHAHADRACRGSSQRDVARISAERRDVVAHELEREPLVQQTVIAGYGVERVLGGEGAVRQESQRSKPVVRRDDNDAGFFGEPAPGVSRKAR